LPPQIADGARIVRKWETRKAGQPVRPPRRREMREQDLIVASIKSVVGTGAAVEHRLAACRARLIHPFEQDGKASVVPGIAE